MERSQCWWKVQYPGPGQDTCFSKGSRLQVDTHATFSDSTRKLVVQCSASSTNCTEQLWQIWNSENEPLQNNADCWRSSAYAYSARWPWISVTWRSLPVMNLMKCNVQASSETRKPQTAAFFSRPLSHLPTIPHRTTPELKCHPRLHSRHNIQCWSWRAAPVAIFAARWRCKCCCKTSMRKDPFHLWSDYERPKRWVLQKNPCGLIKAAVPEGLIGHFQPHKPPQSCMKIDILNSLYETIWLKLSSILKDAAVCTCSNRYWYPQRLSSHETALLSQLCWKAKKWWIDSLIFFDHWVEWLYLHASKLSGNVFGFGPNIEIRTAGVFHSSETQDSLVRIHRLSFRFCNAKHLVVKALVLSRLDQSISEILRLHFEQHNVQCNEVTVHWVLWQRCWCV